MSNRLFYALMCIISLLVGGLLYLVLRENTYISLLFKDSVILETIRNSVKEVKNDFLSFYFPDFLWSFSLCFGLMAVFDPKLIGVIMCCTVSFACGLFWEILQLYEVISGTGDWLDILMYLTVFLAVAIYLMRRNRNEKNC